MAKTARTSQPETNSVNENPSPHQIHKSRFKSKIRRPKTQPNKTTAEAKRPHNPENEAKQAQTRVGEAHKAVGPRAGLGQAGEHGPRHGPGSLHGQRGSEPAARLAVDHMWLGLAEPRARKGQSRAAGPVRAGSLGADQVHPRGARRVDRAGGPGWAAQ